MKPTRASRFLRFLSLAPLRGAIFLLPLPCFSDTAKSSIIPGVKDGHCSGILGNPWNTTLLCVVRDNRTMLSSEPRQIEIHRKGRQPQTIEPGGTVLEWHFWSNGQQFAVHFGTQGSGGEFILYDTASGKQAEEVSGRSESAELPQWAKTPSQIRYESVPEGPPYRQQRIDWISKVIEQLHGIHPGMQRKDLAPFLTTEGGLSTRVQRTYVFRDCPYIKMDIRFQVEGSVSSFDERPEDVIESVSKPYLEFGQVD